MTLKATRREWIGLAVLALPCLIYSMDLTVLYLAVPHISADLRPDATELLWIMDIYGFLIAGSLITMGTLGDHIGRRRLLLIGAAAFGLASLLAAFAGSAEELIAARALQGLAGASLAPSTLSLIRNMFHDDRERSFAIGIWVASFSAGGVVGPLIGGAILAFFDWGAIFLINVPIMLLLLVLGPLLLPEYRDPDAGRLDLASAALSMTSVLALIYGLKHLAAGGGIAVAVPAVVAGLLLGWLFVRRQRQLAEPLIDLRLFRLPGFSAALALNVLALFIAFGFLVLVAQYLQLVRGMGPVEAGLWTVPSGLVFVLGSMVGPGLARRWSIGRVLGIGFALNVLAFGLLALAAVQDHFALFFTGYLLFCLGLSPIGALTSDLVVSSAPAEKAGAASAISETSFEFGGALGVALLGSLVAWMYHTGMTGLPADGLTPALAGTARDTLSGAVQAAATLSGDAGNALLEMARQTFLQAVSLTAGVCAVISLLALALTSRLPAPDRR